MQARGNRSLNYSGCTGNGERKLWKLLEDEIELVDR